MGRREWALFFEHSYAINIQQYWIKKINQDRKEKKCEEKN